MEHIIPFIIRHWWLVAAFVIVLILIIYLEVQSQGHGGGSRTNPAKTVHLMNREKGIVLDVRETSAFQSGHIVNAINIAAKELDHQMKKIAKYKNQPLIIVGATDQSAASVVAKLRKSGFTRVQQLAGGMKSWKEANMPIVESK